MAQEKNAIFRDAALARLASPERLDTRLTLLAYPRSLIVGVTVLLLTTGAFAAWLLARS